MTPEEPREIWTAGTEEEMLELGRAIGRRLEPGCVVLLEGEMGAGKTTLAKGIVEGYGTASAHDVSSPTFPIVHEYRAGRIVYHLDLYRLETEREVRSIGLEDLLDAVEEGAALMLVEWGERFPRLWPRTIQRVTIAATNDEEREVQLIPGKPPYGAGTTSLDNSSAR